MGPIDTIGMLKERILQSLEDHHLTSDERDWIADTERLIEVQMLAAKAAFGNSVALASFASLMVILMGSILLSSE